MSDASSLPFRVLALCSALAVLQPTAVNAQPVTSGSAEPEQGAVELYEVARARFDAGDHTTALNAIEESLAAFDSPNSRLLRAHVLRALGRKVDAMREYRSALEGAKRRLLAGEPRFEPTTAEAGRWIGVLGAGLAEIDVTVGGASPSARLLVNGVAIDLERRERQEAAAKLWLEPGRASIEVIDGPIRVARDVSAAAGSSHRVVLDVRPLPAAPAMPKRDRGAPPVATWVAGGVGLAGMTAFGALGGLALSVDSDLEESCSPTCPPGRIADAEQGERYQVAANVSAAVGAAGLVLGTVLWIVDAATSGPNERPAAPRSSRRGLVLRF